jgi:hypothetical protein
MILLLEDEEKGCDFNQIFYFKLFQLRRKKILSSVYIILLIFLDFGGISFPEKMPFASPTLFVILFSVFFSSSIGRV